LLFISVPVLGQDLHYQLLYDAERQIRDAASKLRSTSTNTSRSSGSSSSSNYNSNYISPNEQKRREIAEVHQTFAKEREERHQKQQRDIQRVQGEVFPELQINSREAQEVFQRAKTEIDASFKTQEQVYRDALAFVPEPIPERDERGVPIIDLNKAFGTGDKFGEQMRDVTDAMFETYEVTASAVVNQLPVHPVVSFALSNVVSATADVGKQINRGQPIDYNKMRRNTVQDGTERIMTPLVEGQLESIIFGK